MTRIVKEFQFTARALEKVHQDRRVAFRQSLHETQEVEVHHLGQDLGVRHELQDAGSHLAPEVEKNRSGQKLSLVLGCRHGDGLLEVDGPQLAEDEGVEERAHVHHGRLGLLGKPSKDNLNLLRKFHAVYKLQGAQT